MKTAVTAFAFCMMAAPLWAVCADDKVTITGDWGQANFTVEVADDNQERAKGLMFVEAMPTLVGMLFVYDRPQSVSFWMKNTVIGLDIIFVRRDGTIESIAAKTVPYSLESVRSGEAVGAVLELAGGRAAELSIKPGDMVEWRY